ncbi:hypothetical protein BH11MYX4_BH11MYX4_09380 [soil metagenome]
MSTSTSLAHAIKFAAGERVHVLCRPTDAEWLPGRVLDAHVLFGRARYVVQLDDDRRLVASAFQIRSRPPVAWADAAMAEVLDTLDMAS